MKGNIYTRQKCEKCGGRLAYNPNLSAFFCAKHPARPVVPGGLYVKFGREVNRRFADLKQAERFLGGLRFETDKGTFDARDYQANNPLAFEKQARKWLTTKAGVSKSHYANLNRFMGAAIAAWGGLNVKAIGYHR